MAEDTKEEAIVIPRVQNIKPTPQIMKEEKQSFGFFLLIIFFLFIGLLILVSYLPMNLAFKILALIFGTFIIEDLHHSFKTLCQNRL